MQMQHVLLKLTFFYLYFLYIQMLVYAIAYISAVLLTFMQVLQCLLLMLTSAEYVSPQG